MNINTIASLIDHSILHPILTDFDLEKECSIALKYQTASVCVKPYHVKMAADLLKKTSVKVCAVIGFPHGNNTIDVKAYETKSVIADGATEVDMVINIGKTLQKDWEYVEQELKIISEECKKGNAILKVIFETDFVTDDIHKIKLCELCTKHKIEFVKTSTGFGYVKQANGFFAYSGATFHDIEFLRKHCPDTVQIKASGGIRTLDVLMEMYNAGARRIGTSSTIQIMEEAKARFGE